MGFALAALAVSLWLTTTMTSCPSLVQLLKQVCASVMYSVPGNDTCTRKQASAFYECSLPMLAQQAPFALSREIQQLQLSPCRHQAH